MKKLMKRKLLFAVGLYFASFAIGIVVALILGIDMSGQSDITTEHWIWSIVLSVLVTAFFSEKYFSKAKRTIEEAWHLGLTYLGVGVVIDSLFMIPYAIVNGTSALIKYYSEPLFYVSVVLIVLTPVVLVRLKK